jgi:prepilin-type N-terminal cleavage/methylation domain-containing protein
MVNRANTVHGVTLLELLVVIAIISILSMVATPSIKPFLAAMNLRTATNTVKQQLILAKTRAMGNPNIHCGVYFDSSVTPNQTQAFLDTSLFYQYNSSDPKYMPVYSMPKNITLSVGGTGVDKVMVFRGDGSAKTGTPGIYQNKIVVTVTVTSKGGTLIKSKTISVLPSTGRIKVQ